MNWLWTLVEAVRLRWGRLRGKAIRCGVCKNLSWNGVFYEDGKWACVPCASAGTLNTRPFHNRDKAPLHVNFLLMESAGGHKVECPVCEEGIFTMRRDHGTGELLDWDTCSLCGQTVIFDDIEFVKKTTP